MSGFSVFVLRVLLPLLMARVTMGEATGLVKQAVSA
jgi:hypothetical protein